MKMKETKIRKFEKKIYDSEPSYLFDKFWMFIAERQNIFFKRIQDESKPWTDDEILAQYKFTNVYRVCDRVSQYLIRNIIYSKKIYSDEDLLFRILFFKIFNRIETWENCEKALGDICFSTFNFASYDAILTDLMSNYKIYSAAYIMPSGVSSFGYNEKHKNHLKLLDYMFNDNIVGKLAATSSLKDVYNLLLGYPTIGSFLAFQYAIDINYSELIDFSEMSFVKAGPGALRGIKKCFPNSTKTPEEIISLVAENQDSEFGIRGINFKKIGNRNMQLIDCQNVFCEFDKYTRVSNPEISAGNVRIKQKFNENRSKIEYFFPPKWNIDV